MSKQQQKQQQTLEPSGNDKAENRKPPFRAPAMLPTIGDFVDRFDGVRKDLNNKEGKNSTLIPSKDKKQTTGNYTDSVK
jgi:hypothetical protein